MFGLPLAKGAYTRLFRQMGGVSPQTQQFQAWKKPQNCSMFYFYLIGGGGGGGGGFTGTGVNRGGGAGGSASAVVKILAPSIMIPDVLYMNVGVGGPGGAANTNGTAGLSSYIQARAASGGLTGEMWAIANNGALGPAGTGVAGGTGPASGSATSSTTLGMHMMVVGNTGGNAGNGGAFGAGANVAVLNFPCGCGAGGGGVTSGGTQGVGGNQTGSGVWPTISGGAIGGGDGVDGPDMRGFETWLFRGGSGGGGNNLGTGGRGGNGSFGSGGGGGGGGATGGSGGRGGDGLILVIGW